MENALTNVMVMRLRHPESLDPYALNGETISVTRAMDGLKLTIKAKPASKPANPAFDRVLRRSQHMRIGLRYPGD